jgi:hypothetical protein
MRLGFLGGSNDEKVALACVLDFSADNRILSEEFGGGHFRPAKVRASVRAAALPNNARRQN